MRRALVVGGLILMAGVGVGFRSSGLIQAADGTTVLSSNTDVDADGPDGVGFGPAIRRFFTANLYNSDFAQAPPTTADLSDTNPLPYWRFASLSGSAITARSILDESSASGRVIRFEMVAGAASDSAYIEQIIPVNGSRNRAFAYGMEPSFLGVSSDVGQQFWFTGTYLKADGATTTGSGWSVVGSVPGPGVVSSTSSSASVPADAYYLKVRVGLERAAAANGASATLDLCDALIRYGSSQILVADRNDPTNRPFELEHINGVLTLSQTFDTGAITVPGQVLGLADNEATISVVAGTTIAPNHSVLRLTASSPVTVTATPTVSSPPVLNGGVNPIIVLINEGSNAITIQDQGTLGGSNLRLSTATFAIGARDNITLMWNQSIGDWIEIARTNVI